MSQTDQQDLARLEAEALDLLDEIDAGLVDVDDKQKQFRHKLREIHDRELYTAYGTWEVYCKRVYNLHRVKSYRLLNRAKLEILLSNPSDVQGVNILAESSGLSDLLTLSAGQAEVLWTYPQEVQLEAWRRAKREDPLEPGPALLKRCADEAMADFLNAQAEREAASSQASPKRPHGQRETVSPLDWLNSKLAEIMKGGGRKFSDAEQAQLRDALRPVMDLLAKWKLA
jgi:hypothetical protein